MDVLFFLKERQQQYKEDWSYSVQLNISRIQVKRMGSVYISHIHWNMVILDL